MSTKLTATDLVQADDRSANPPSSGFTRIYAGPDGKIYRRTVSGHAVPLEPEVEELWVALGQVRAALTFLGLDPALIDIPDALDALN